MAPSRAPPLPLHPESTDTCLATHAYPRHRPHRLLFLSGKRLSPRTVPSQTLLEVRNLVAITACGSPAILHAPAEPEDGGSRTGAWSPPTHAAAPAGAGPRSCVSDSDMSHDTVPSARRPVAGSALPLPASPAPPLAAPAGSPLFCDYRLQRPNVHRLLGD